jgi:hypothetical protein
MPDWSEMPYGDAVKYLRGLAPMTKDEWATLKVRVRQHAFTISRVMKLAEIQSFLDAISDATQAGETPEEFAGRVETLELGISDAQVAQVMAENVQRAFGAGSWDYGQANAR